MREVVLDTETTGLDPAAGHRIVEIGGVALFDSVPTGETYQEYVNPERDVPAEAFAIHGLSTEFLADKPVFEDVVEGFLAFIGDARLVIHNSEFDLGFINAELDRLSRPPLSAARAVDTVQLARHAFPGAPAGLDALCRRFRIDIGHRVQHGALKDADLLAQVYLELTGGRQPGLALAAARRAQVAVVRAPGTRAPRAHGPTPDEAAAHKRFLAEAVPGALWDDP